MEVVQVIVNKRIPIERCINAGPSRIHHRMDKVAAETNALSTNEEVGPVRSTGAFSLHTVLVVGRVLRVAVAVVEVTRLEEAILEVAAPTGEIRKFDF